MCNIWCTYFQDELTRGYDIVICTPPCLLRLLEIPEMFNLKRLCHLVLDEAHFLLDSYYDEVYIFLCGSHQLEASIKR